MIQEFVERFMAGKDVLRKQFSEVHPQEYLDIVKAVIGVLFNEEDDETPDPQRIHKIDDGDYQGTLLFVVASNSYQPGKYWYVKIAYGSCSGCDTLCAIRNYADERPTSKQIDEYMILALHVVQAIKCLEDK